MTKQDVTVVLLAGGLATRLPGKLMLDVAGETMLARAYRQLTSSGWPCVVSTRHAHAAQIHAALERSQNAQGLPCAVEIAFDEIEHGGPLEGLRRGLNYVRTPLAFAAAADIPDLSAKFCAKLLAAYEEAPAPKPAAVLPTWPDGKVEPLAALYDVKLVARGADAALRSGRRKVTAAIDGLNVLEYPVTPEDAHVLRNINTPDDYESYGQINSSATRSIAEGDQVRSNATGVRSRTWTLRRKA